jgi:hypothetical protein
VIPPLDIFKLEPDGQLLWKGTAEDLATAKFNVKPLVTNSPGEYTSSTTNKRRYRRELVRLVTRSEEQINSRGFGHGATQEQKHPH